MDGQTDRITMTKTVQRIASHGNKRKVQLTSTTNTCTIESVSTLKHVKEKLSIGEKLQQEAQLLLGDRATRKHAKDC